MTRLCSSTPMHQPESRCRCAQEPFRFSERFSFAWCSQEGYNIDLLTRPSLENPLPSPQIHAATALQHAERSSTAYSASPTAATASPINTHYVDHPELPWTPHKEHFAGNAHPSPDSRLVGGTRAAPSSGHSETDLEVAAKGKEKYAAYQVHFWQTRKGIAIIVLVAMLVVAAVVGASVCTTRKKSVPSMRTESASVPSGDQSQSAATSSLQGRPIRSTTQPVAPDPTTASTSIGGGG
jgi:hypothetical protein